MIVGISYPFRPVFSDSRLHGIRNFFLSYYDVIGYVYQFKKEREPCLVLTVLILWA